MEPNRDIVEVLSNELSGSELNTLLLSGTEIIPQLFDKYRVIYAVLPQ